MRLTSTPTPLQLEESNRTLTVDVANLASEKEELNNQLKDMQQRECPFLTQWAPQASINPGEPSVCRAAEYWSSNLHYKLRTTSVKLLWSKTLYAPWINSLLCYLYRVAESQGAGEADELTQSVLWKAAAEWKNAENSGVCLGAYTSLESLAYFLYFIL